MPHQPTEDLSVAKYVYGDTTELSSSDLVDPSRQKGVDYTVMGVTTTKPVHNLGKNATTDDVYDKPVKEKAEVIPWNGKGLPIVLIASLPRCRWFIGDNLQFDLGITNRTDKKVKCMTVVLIKRKPEYPIKNVNLALDMKNEMVVKSQEIVTHGFPVPARFRHNGKMNFKLPFDLDGFPAFLYYVQLRAGVIRHNGPTVLLGPLKLEKRIL